MAKRRPASLDEPGLTALGDPSWASYTQTILAFPRADQLRADLRLPLAPSTIAQLTGLGPVGRFAVVTPYNPGGIRYSDDDNSSRLVAFLDSLKRHHVRFTLADGLSPDMQHRERGAAVGLSVKDALSLANEWSQTAFFWFDSKAFWLVPTSDPRERVHLPASTVRGVPSITGYSRHDLSPIDVQSAFAEAERVLGTDWKVKGRGHCRRVTLHARFSRYAIKGAEHSYAFVTPKWSGSSRRLFPLAIVERAASSLGVSAWYLVSREF